MTGMPDENVHRLIEGDCRDAMATLNAESVDAIVTDPPYGLSFMGKSWDDGVPGVEFWTEAMRVAKPGAHLLAFGGTRTYHRLACAIEEAGWEIRDCVMWVYGSGFPKSLDVSKAIDRMKHDRDEIEQVVRWMEATRKASGVSRKQVEERFGTINIGQAFFTITPGSAPRVPTLEQVPILLDLFGLSISDVPDEIHRLLIDKNASKGQPGPNWFKREVTGQHNQSAPGQSLQKYSDHVALPPKERRDIPATPAAQQWQGWGTTLKPAWEPIIVARKPLVGTVAKNVLTHGTGAINVEGCRVAGRWPANLIHDGSQEVVGLTGSAARFFYCAKASKADRDAGCKGNHHPTVKPTALMRYLCRLVTPPGGIVLDPFTGSGSTGKGAVLEGFRFIGIEREAEYVEIARARITETLNDLDPHGHPAQDQPQDALNFQSRPGGPVRGGGHAARPLVHVCRARDGGAGGQARAAGGVVRLPRGVHQGDGAGRVGQGGQGQCDHPHPEPAGRGAPADA